MSNSDCRTSFVRLSAPLLLALLAAFWLAPLTGAVPPQAKSAPQAAEAEDDPAASPTPKAVDDKQDDAQKARESANRRQRDFEERRQRMLRELWDEQSKHEPSAFERCHDGVKAAFREVVASTRRSTVRIHADGKQVALGAIVRADGLIVSKASELNGKLECELSDGRRLPATLVTTDQRNDLALLRVAARELAPVKWTTENATPVGSWLATVGPGVNPEAIGVVSVAAREIRPARGILGVLLGEGSLGSKIEEVLPGSGASEAGIKPGDVLLSINGRKVPDRHAAMRALSRMKAGDRVRLLLSRGEKEVELTAKLGTADMGGVRVDRFQMMNMLGGPLSVRRAGFASAIQHDTVLLPQQCGGPVVDVDGRVIGLNIARGGRVDSYAIPASVVQKLVAAQPAAADPQPVSKKAGVQ